MKILVLSMVLCVTIAYAVPRYVAPNGGNISPYTSWAMAAATIQSAINAANDGDEILVSNGTYNITAEISVGKAVTITSIAGAVSTVVKGN